MVEPTTMHDTLKVLKNQVTYGEEKVRGWAQEDLLEANEIEWDVSIICT